MTKKDGLKKETHLFYPGWIILLSYFHKMYVQIIKILKMTSLEPHRRENKQKNCVKNYH